MMNLVMQPNSYLLSIEMLAFTVQLELLQAANAIKNVSNI
jgi:hypothetical protein